MGFRVQSLGFRVQGLGFRARGFRVLQFRASGSRVQGLQIGRFGREGFRIWDFMVLCVGLSISKFRVYGVRPRAYGRKCRAKRKTDGRT